MRSSFPSLPLLSVKSELDRSLSAISQELESAFSSSQKSQSLSVALTELHRLIGVVQMLGLRGLAVFCSELEIHLQQFNTDPADIPALRQDTARRALFGLTHYLDALADGASNATLRLFGEYQELLQVRGVEMAFEIDLFFPDLSVQLPVAILKEPQQADPNAGIKHSRMIYQQNLLKWLRKDNPREALGNMMAAMRVVLACAAPDQHRAFWWVAGGLLNCVFHEGIPPELDVKKSLSRIDQRMRSLLDGSEFDEVSALSELLYLVGRSHTVSEAVEDIKNTYDLETYLLSERLLPPSEINKSLDSMQSQLQILCESWELCIKDDTSACSNFAEQANQLYLISELLDHDTLQFLCKQIQSYANAASTPQLAQYVSMEMAMALLLLSNGILHYQHLDKGFHEQTRLLSMRLQEASLRKQEDAEKLANLVGLYCEAEQREVLAPLANEMRVNLHHIEQIINDYFSKPAKLGELAQLDRLLNQIHGAFHILSLETADHLLAILRRVTDDFQKGALPSDSETHLIALAISHLSEYVHGLSLGRKPDAENLKSVSQELTEEHERAIQPGSTDVIQEESIPQGINIQHGDVDAELLHIFLEEAQEVLETLRTNVESSRLHAASKEPLITMRRGFHTLKGGSRMVGQTEFGETAWAIERAMNKWLEKHETATPILLEMIGDAVVLFQYWVDMLLSPSSASRVNTAPLLELAARVESGEEKHTSIVATVELPEQTAAEELKIVEPTPIAVEPEIPSATAPAEEAIVQIGSLSISPALFRIATEEAEQLIGNLKTLLAGIRADEKAVITFDFMRAAHTVAGINRTLGFECISELAHALELWLQFHINQQTAVTASDLDLLSESVAALDIMCKAVREYQEPQPLPDLLIRLHIVKEDVAQIPPEQVTLVQEPVVPIIPDAIHEPAFVDQVAYEEPKPSSPEAQTAVASSRAVQDDLDEQLLPIFLEEAHELYSQISNTLEAWRDKPTDESLGRNLQRSLHTLKGSARMAGAMRLGELTHLVEERISQSVAAQALGGDLWNDLDSFLDRIGHAIDQLQNPHTASPAESAEPDAPQTTPQTPNIVAPATLEIGAERAIHSALLRVRSDVVDKLVNEAGEISVARSRIETELREFKTGVVELTESVNRLRHQLREIEIQAEGQMQARTAVSGDSADKFDPLEFDRFTRFQELTRFMNESVHDVQTVQHSLLKNLDETVAALSAQSQLNRDLQQGLMAIRMVPFASIRERLYRVVRQTGKELGKRANLELLGTDIELDRSVLDKMTAPFEHLLRNAIAHGLETSDIRERMGKGPIGEIRLSLRQESNEVVFVCSDDGAGLDLERIRQKALESGLIKANEMINDEQVMQLIFKAGLTTAHEVSEISGRGVGLDVVSSEISSLGGRVDVSSEHGRGVTFTIHLPLTLAVTRTLMVRAGHTLYALPSSLVARVEQLKADDLEVLYKQKYFDWQGVRYPLYYLPRLLGDEQAEIVIQPHNPVLLLKSGDHCIALHVDHLHGNQEAVVKNIGPQLARLPGISGATVSGSGEVILIINPVAFSQRILATRQADATFATQAVRKVPIIMVVDDSLTVRKISTRLLERAGYQVVTAKDGVDALEQLLEITPDVMLLDVEMPRMDGFELTKRLRQDSKTRTLPIIMITSRTADKHRNYALELGVNEYMGKPFQEEELLQHLSRFVSQPS